MKKRIKKIVSGLMAIALLCSMILTPAFAASNVIRYNISSSEVSCNASSGNLPSAATVYAGKSYYFNLQASSDVKLKTATLYVKPVGSSSYSKAYTYTANNYFRYTSKKYTFGNKSGTFYYYWTTKTTGGTTKTYSATKVAVNASVPSSVIRYNVSSSAVNCNASNGNLPSAATVYAGSSYYFNLQVSNDVKLKTATLYVKPVGSSSYSKVYTYTAKNYFCYTSKKYTFGNKAGTFYYYWTTKTTGGTTKTYSATKITVKEKESDYTQKVNAFISDARWKNGISWKASQTPKLSGYSSKGCCAYAADFAKYVFGKAGPRDGTRFTSASSIKDGDILHLSPNHWIVVLSRSGNTLRTAEGNASSKVVIKNGKYTISGSKIKTSSTTYTIADGYHFK